MIKGKKLILVYHRINDTTYDFNRITVKPLCFEEHLRYLKENFEILSVCDILKYDGTRNAVAVTFDDGYKDFYDIALPLLKKYDFPATVFISTQNIGEIKEFWMTELLRLLYFSKEYEEELELNIFGQDIRLPVSNINQRTEAYAFLRNVFMRSGRKRKEDILDSIRRQLKTDAHGRKEYLPLHEEEIRYLAQEKLVDIGAHTVSHPSLARLGREEMQAEVQESMEVLTKLTGKKIKMFAYPFGGTGDHNDVTKDILMDNEIEYAFTVENRMISDGEDTFCIPRAYVYDLDISEFKHFIKGVFDECKKEKEQKSFSFFGKRENDRIESDDNVVIWGTGKNAISVYKYLYGRCMIKAFVDNAPRKNGDTLEDLPIWSVQDFLKNDKDFYVIVKNNHDFEIIEQLNNLNIKRIHWWR